MHPAKIYAYFKKRKDNLYLKWIRRQFRRFGERSSVFQIDNLFLRIPKIRCKFLERMGRDSMLYYVTHFILIYNLSYWDSVRWQLDKWVLFGILVAGLAIFLPLVRFVFTREKLRWATGA